MNKMTFDGFYDPITHSQGMYFLYNYMLFRQIWRIFGVDLVILKFSLYLLGNGPYWDKGTFFCLSAVSWAGWKVGKEEGKAHSSYIDLNFHALRNLNPPKEIRSHSYYDLREHGSVKAWGIMLKSCSNGTLYLSLLQLLFLPYFFTACVPLRAVDSFRAMTITKSSLHLASGIDKAYNKCFHF